MEEEEPATETQKRDTLSSKGSFRSAQSLEGTIVKNHSPPRSKASEEGRWSQDRYSREENTREEQKDDEIKEEEEETRKENQSAQSHRDREYLRFVYEKLDGGIEGQVKRQDLLSITSKIQDTHILQGVRESNWLSPLLRPEVWGRRLLKTEFSVSGFVTFEAFTAFWEEFMTEYAELGSEYNRRDTYDSVESFQSGKSSSASSQPPPNIRVPNSNRKVLRALSVRTKESQDTRKSSQKTNPVNGIRVTVENGIEENAAFGKRSLNQSDTMPPQLIIVPDTYEDLVSLICERFRISKEENFILMHSVLHAQISSVEELREGDSLLLTRKQPSSGALIKKRPSTVSLPSMGSRKHSLQSVRTLASNIDLNNTTSDPAPDQSNKNDSASVSRNQSEDLTANVLIKGTTSAFSTFVRRPSWQEHFAASRLPQRIRTSLHDILTKISLSSNRWQKEYPEESLPDSADLAEHMKALASNAEPLTLEIMFKYIDVLGISYGIAHNHSRLLFAAMDIEGGGTISFRHFQEMVEIWLGVWTRNQERLRKQKPLESDKKTSSETNEESKNIDERGSTSTTEAGTEQVPLTPKSRSSTPLPPFLSGTTAKSHHVKISAVATSKRERFEKARANASAFTKRKQLNLSRPQSAAQKHSHPNKGKIESEDCHSTCLIATSCVIESESHRPRTAPEQNQSILGKKKSQNPYNFSSEEEYLRALHRTEKDDYQLLLAYASFLLQQVSSARRSEVSLMSVYGESSSSKIDDTSVNHYLTPAIVLDENTEKKVRKAREVLKRALTSVNLDKHIAEKTADLEDIRKYRIIRAAVLHRLAETCELLSNDGQARTLFHKAIEDHPSGSEILTRYALFLHRRGDIDGARDYFLEALVHNKNCIDALLGYAVLLTKSTDPADVDQASQYFERARMVAKGSKVAPEMRGKVLAQVGLYFSQYQGNHEEAIDCLEQALQCDPSLASVWFDLGRIKFAAHRDIQGAIRAFEGALAVDEYHSASIIALAQILANSVAKVDVERAETLFRRGMSLEPQNPRFLISYAEFCSNVLKADIRAESLFESAYKHTTGESRAICLYKWAVCYESRSDRVGDPSAKRKASSLYERALIAKRSCSEEGLSTYLVALGKCALQCSQHEKAQKALSEAIEVDPNRSDAKWLLGLVEQILGRRTKAGKFFRSAFEEDPKNGFVLVHFARFILDYKGPSDPKQVDVAETMLRKALRIANAERSKTDQPIGTTWFDSFDVVAMVTLGKLLSKRETTHSEGLRLLEKAVERCPQAYEARLVFAECLSDSLIEQRVALYSQDDDRAGDMQRSTDIAIENFISASELNEESIICSAKACVLLLFKSGTAEDKVASQMFLDRALKYAERANRRSIKYLDAWRRDPSKEKTVRATELKLAEAQFLLGVVKERQENFVQAKEHFHKAIEMNPNHVLALFHMSHRVERDHNNLEAAQELVLQALGRPAANVRPRSDFFVLCDLVMQSYARAESTFLLSEGEINGADPMAARSLVMHQQLAKKAREILSNVVDSN